MKEPKWLSLLEVQFIHEKSIQQAGGSHGIRDGGLLESALARPQNQYTYGEIDIFQLASSYAESISRNHPFVDGNKRTAFMAADVFLFYNGHDLQASEGENHADMIEHLAQGKITKEAAGHYLKKHSLQL